ncbi:transporter substrate-binding domain-containing protein [Leuconostocaceae bacterium ESL0723]|nr:transporter substrate-binding domain-containing protein [Leuconostocaceae bacterium ESL0723]
MKKIIIILVGIAVVIAAIFGFTQLNQDKKSYTITKGTFTVGLEGTYAPFSYLKDGKLTGFEVELAQDLGDKMGLKTKFVQTKWDSLIAGLGANRYDAVINNIGINPERKKAYLLSDPYVYPRTVLIKRSTDNQLNGLDDIKGKKMAQSTTSNYGKLAKEKGGDIVAVPGMVEAMNLLTTDRAEGSLNDFAAFQAWKQANPGSDLTTIDVSKHVTSYPSGVLINKDNKELQKKVNKALKELREDGTLKKLSEKYFGEDLTNKQ